MTTVTIPFPELKRLITDAAPFVERDPIPILKCVRLAAHEGKLVATATDRYSAIRVNSVVPCPDDLVAHVPAATWKRTLTLLDPGRGQDGLVTLALDADGSSLDVIRGDMSVRLPVEQGAYPTLDPLFEADPDAPLLKTAVNPAYLRRLPLVRYEPLAMASGAKESRGLRPLILTCQSYTVAIMPMKLADQ